MCLHGLQLKTHSLCLTHQSAMTQAGYSPRLCLPFPLDAVDLGFVSTSTEVLLVHGVTVICTMPFP